jgi:hypothetical protein
MRRQTQRQRKSFTTKSGTHREAKRVTLAVDIVAGTSAGGRMAPLLAALASGAPLPNLKEFWE